MQYGEFDINNAQGVRLLTDIRLGEQLFRKGHALTAEDIIIFKMYDIRKIYGVIMADFDVDAATAAGMIAAKLCGDNTAFKVASNGHTQIVALTSGVFMLSSERLAKFNRLHPELVLNALEPYSLVEPNRVIAEFVVRTPLMPQAEVDDVLFKLSGNSSLLTVAPIATKRAALIYTELGDTLPGIEHFTATVTELVRATSGLGIEFVSEYHAQHTIDALADEVEKAMRSGHDICFILPALPISGSVDVIPEAIRSIVDEIACQSLPILGAADFIAAEKRATKIISLPYDYAFHDASLVNKTIKQVIFSEKLQAQDYRNLSPVILPKQPPLDDVSPKSLIMPKNYGASNKKANIAAIILAAGQGKRAGRNKLMVDAGDEIPLFMKAVEAAIRSHASPVYVITGYNAENMQPYLDEIDVNVIYNPAYYSGVKTSIDLGLKSVPNFCDGALLLPADMPNLTATELNKLIAKFKPGVEKQVIMFANKGIKSNPIIWSRALFEKADIVPENAQIRPVFMEHSDYITIVELKDKNKLLDINYPLDITTYTNHE